MKSTAFRAASLSFVTCSIALALALGACRSEADRPSAPVDAQGQQQPVASAAAAGQPEPKSDKPAYIVVPDARRLHDDVAWLADDAQEGRRAGTEAGKKAGDWLAARLKQLGLQPAGEKDSYEQAFEVPKPVEVGPNSSLSWKGQSSGAATLGDGVAPVFCSSGGDAHGALDWLGYGLINADKNWNDYATRCDGRVVMIVRGTPPASSSPAPSEAGAAANPHGGNVEQGDGWGNSGSLFLKVMNAKRNGAVAVIIAPHPSQASEPLPPFDASRVAIAGIPAVFVSAGIADQLCAGWRDAILQSDDREKSAAESAAGAVKHSGSPTGTALELEVTVRADITREKGPAYNVLAKLPGKNHDRVVVVGAHYDHLGLGGEGSLAPNEYGHVHNGADDNASGTAAVLEIARVMSRGAPPACDVLFALWSGEELGLLGSENWAQHPTIPLEKVVANLNLDMVGRAGNNPLAVLGIGSSAPFAGMFEGESAKFGLDLKLSGAGNTGVGGSDHETFLKRKIPALFFFSGLHADYHKPSDDTERFEADGAAKVAALGIDVVRKLCAARELAWTEPPAPESTGASTERLGAPFRVWFGTVPEYTYADKGLLLAGTSAGSPAEKAGMLKGDVILQVGDIEIETINDFMYALQTYKPGDVVLTRFVRDGKEESVRVTLSTRDAQ